MTDDELRAYIHGKLAESRTAKSTKERVHSVVRFEPQKANAGLTRNDLLQLLSDWLLNWEPKPSKRLGIVYPREYYATLWGESYIRCGRCKRGWDAWLAENPVSEPLDEWISKAKSVVIEKRWI